MQLNSTRRRVELCRYKRALTIQYCTLNAQYRIVSYRIVVTMSLSMPIGDQFGIGLVSLKCTRGRSQLSHISVNCCQSD